MTAMDRLTVFYALGSVAMLVLIGRLLWQKHHQQSEFGLL
jgi:hypothetical protein